jgi:hypothetical protein
MTRTGIDQERKRSCLVNPDRHDDSAFIVEFEADDGGVGYRRGYRRRRAGKEIEAPENVENAQVEHGASVRAADVGRRDEGMTKW